MKIEVLGSGNFDSVHPSASTIIDRKVLVDAPAGIMKELKSKNYNPCDIEVCLITHFHTDHYFDIPAFLTLKSHNARKDSIRDISLVMIGPKDIEKKVYELMHLAFESDYADRILSELKIKYIECEDFANIILAKDLIITTIKVEHVDKMDAYGFIIEDGKNKVGFSGDSKLCEGVMQIVENSEAIFIDTTFQSSKEEDAHMGINDIEKIADGYKDLKVITTHMQDETREKLMSKLQLRKEIREKNNIKVEENIIIGEEGLIINL